MKGVLQSSCSEHSTSSLVKEAENNEVYVRNLSRLHSLFNQLQILCSRGF